MVLASGHNRRADSETRSAVIFARPRAEERTRQYAQGWNGAAPNAKGKNVVSELDDVTIYQLGVVIAGFILLDQTLTNLWNVLEKRSRCP